MRRHRRRDSPDTVELLLKMALGEIEEAEFEYLLTVTGDYFRIIFSQHQEATGLGLPSAAVIRGTCELVLWETVDFIKELTGLNAVDERERQIARQTFRIDVYLQDNHAQAIRKYATLAVKSAVWEVSVYRLLGD